MKKVQIDKNPKHIGRRTSVDLGFVGDIKMSVAALLKRVSDKSDGRFLEKHLAETIAVESTKGEGKPEGGEGLV